MPSSSQRRPFLRLLLIGLCACLLSPLASADQAKRLRIGITLHPYYSYVANIVGAGQGSQQAGQQADQCQAQNRT